MADIEFLGVAARRHLRDVLPHYEVSDHGDGYALFVCARCKRKFAYPINGRFLIPAAFLAAHLMSHGVRFDRPARLDRAGAGKRARARAAGASPRPTLWPGADRAETGAGPVQRR